MNAETENTFIQLFKDAYKKYFHHELKVPMTEVESKLFCIEIEEKTGLVIGFKSVKNYSIYVTKRKGARKENPSLTTLDILARYVLNAPVATEQERKRNEDHYPYWHLYQKHKRTFFLRYKNVVILVLLAVPAIALILLFMLKPNSSENTVFIDDFDDVSDASLKSNAWTLISENIEYWERRGEENGFLKLFTLMGDNWPDQSVPSLEIKNLLIRPVNAPCFTVETNIVDFFPNERWQQTGLIFLEDSSLNGKVMHLSIVFNDFFGGFDNPGEIILQGISSQGNDKPEEFINHRLFQLSESFEKIIKDNLKFCGLRIEKNNDEFRFLLAYSSYKNAAYREIGKLNSNININYVGIFALSGNADESGIIPARFDRFSLETYSCEE